MKVSFIAATAALMFVTAAFAGKNTTFDLNGDQAKLLKKYVTVKNPKALSGIKKVAIAQFQVEFVTNTSAAATAYATQNPKNSATVHCSYALKNMDTAQFQALTDKLYSNLVEQFKSSGIEVRTQEALATDDVYQKLTKKPRPTPFDVKTMDGTSLFFSANGMPFYFDQNDKRMGLGKMFASQFSNFNPAGFENKIAKKTGAAVVKVRLVVTFANMDAKGGWWRDVASVNTKLKVTLIPEFTKFTVVTAKGTAVEQVKSPVFADGVFINEVANALSSGEKVANALSGVAGAIGGTSSKTLKYNAMADPAAYAMLVEKHVGAIDKLFFTYIKK